MVTQRIANPFIPVRFWAWPPKNSCFIILKKYVLNYSSVAQLVEQLTVNQLVAGSSPARGAINQSFLMKQYFLEFVEFFLFGFLITMKKFCLKMSNLNQC